MYRFPGAAQHERLRNGALQTRDPEIGGAWGRSRLSAALLRAALRPGHPGWNPRHPHHILDKYQARTAMAWPFRPEYGIGLLHLPNATHDRPQLA